MLDKFIEEMKVNRSIITTKGGVKVTFDILDREHGLAFMDSEGARFKCFMFRVNDDETLSVDPEQALKEVGEVLYQVEASKPKTFMESLSEVGYCGFVGDENGKPKWVDRPGTARLKEYNEKIEEIKKKLGCKSLSQFAAQVCQSENYRKYINCDYYLANNLYIEPTDIETGTAQLMRLATKVESRAQYNIDPEAAQRFYDHFQEYKGWANDQAK